MVAPLFQREKKNNSKNTLKKIIKGIKTLRWKRALNEKENKNGETGGKKKKSHTENKENGVFL